MRIRKNFFALIISALSLSLLLPQIHADDTRHKPDVKAWKKLRADGQKAMEQKRYSEAVQPFAAALAEARNFDADDYCLAESLEDLADALWETHDYLAT